MVPKTRRRKEHEGTKVGGLTAIHSGGSLVDPLADSADPIADETLLLPSLQPPLATTQRGEELNQTDGPDGEKCWG